MTMSKLSGADISTGLTAVTNALPLLLAAYEGFKAVWTAMHPGTTEVDYIAYLEQASAEGHTFAAGWLTAQGYTQDAAGNWVPPASAPDGHV